MTRFGLTKTDLARACDPRRVVSVDDTGLARQSGLDGCVVFSALAALTIVTLAVIGAPFSSILLVALGFAGLIAIAAREYIADVASGLVLRYAQPYKPGETVHLYSAGKHDYVDATVIKLGAVHTTLAAPDGVLVVPNHFLLIDEARKESA